MNVCNELLCKKKDESFEQYRVRCYSLKDALGYTWDEMAEVINQYSDIPHSESWYRKEAVIRSLCIHVFPYAIITYSIRYRNANLEVIPNNSPSTNANIIFFLSFHKLILKRFLVSIP